jgi:transcriptional regulator with XRE-family HTH domain
MANKANQKHVDPTPATNTPDFIDLTPKELTKQEFGRRVQAFMLNKGWNQSDLARASKLGRDAISTYIRGVSFPEPVNLKKLAAALGVEQEQLLPNAAMRAMDSDPSPMLEIKQAHGHPDQVWLRVNRLVSFEVAAEIFNLLKSEGPATV